MKSLFSNRIMWLALLVLTSLAGIGWWQHQPALAWYHVRQLAAAYEENRESCAIKVAELDEVAVPRLLDGLHNSDAIVCANMQYALVLLAKKWGVTDPRSQRLVESVHLQFGDFSPPGQEKVVMLLTGFLQHDGPKPLPPRLTKVVSEILIGAEKKPELRSAALLLAAELIDCVEPGQWVDVCREMAERGLKEERGGARLASLQLLLREPMRKDKGLVEKAIPLLRDPEPTVRRAALLALATESDAVREEHFLPLLHDDDSETQYLCEMALRKRGLTDDDLRVARMLGDKNPATRIRVLHLFQQMPELNFGEVLRRLSHDPEPAVRAAAIRVAADFPHVNLLPRLREIADGDPSPAVRLNARYYLSMHSPRAALN